jgi:hypothetical protein
MMGMKNHLARSRMARVVRVKGPGLLRTMKKASPSSLGDAFFEGVMRRKPQRDQPNLSVLKS